MVLTVRSTTETVGVGTRNAMPVSLPLTSGQTRPTALAAPVALTFSIGLAACPDDGETVAELLGRADERLYAAKQAGRNRVQGWSAAPEPAS